MTLQILELFGGIGSPRVALREMGIPVKSIDSWNNARRRSPDAQPLREARKSRYHMKLSFGMRSCVA